MRVCTLMQVAAHLEHDSKLDQALNCFHQAQRELSRWRNPDAMLREQSRRVMEALQRLRDVVDQSNPLLQALQKEEQGDGLPQAWRRKGRKTGADSNNKARGRIGLPATAFYNHCPPSFCKCFCTGFKTR